MQFSRFANDLPNVDKTVDAGNNKRDRVATQGTDLGQEHFSSALMKKLECDAFLCHKRDEKDSVKDLAEMLHIEAGTFFFLDEFAIPPSSEFKKFIERAIRHASSVVIFLGKTGWGETHLWEAKIALAVEQERANTKTPLRIIPVILPGANEADWGKLFPGGKLPFNWISFSSLPATSDCEQFLKLKSAIHGNLETRLSGPESITPYLVRRQAALWAKGGARDHLWQGKMLRGAKTVLIATPQMFSGDAVAKFFDACDASEKKTRNIRRLLGLAVVALIMFAVFMKWQYDVARGEKGVAEATAQVEKEKARNEGDLRKLKEAQARSAELDARARKLCQTAERLVIENPETATILPLVAKAECKLAGISTPFFVDQALFNSAEHLDGFGIAREDGTVQVVKLDDETIITCGAESNMLRTKKYSDTGWQELWNTKVPEINGAENRDRPRRFCLSPDNKWVAILGSGSDEELAFVDLATGSVLPVLYRKKKSTAKTPPRNVSNQFTFSVDSKAFFFQDHNCNLHVVVHENEGWRIERNLKIGPAVLIHPLGFCVYEQKSWFSDNRGELACVDVFSAQKAKATKLGPHTGSEWISAQNYMIDKNDVSRSWRIDEETREISNHSSNPILGDWTKAAIADASPSRPRLLLKNEGGKYGVYEIDKSTLDELPPIEAVKSAMLLFDDRVLVQSAAAGANGQPGTQQLNVYSAGKADPDLKIAIPGEDYSLKATSAIGAKCLLTNRSGQIGGALLVAWDSATGESTSKQIRLRPESWSPGLTQFSDGQRLWNENLGASMTFVNEHRLPKLPFSNPLDSSEINSLFFVSEKMVLSCRRSFRSSETGGELLYQLFAQTLSADGRTSTSTILHEGKSDYNVRVKAAFVEWNNDTECGVWPSGLQFQKPHFNVSSSDLGNERIRHIAYNAKHRLLLVLTKPFGEISLSSSVWVCKNVADPIPNKLEELQFTTDFSNIGWLDDTLFYISVGSIVAASERTGDSYGEQTILCKVDASSPNTSVTRTASVPFGGYAASSSNSRRLCLGSQVSESRQSAEQVRLLDIDEDGKIQWQEELKNELGYRRFEGVQISPDGRWVAILGNSPILFSEREGVWSSEYFQADHDRISDLIFSPDSKWAVSRRENEDSLVFWHLEMGKPLEDSIRLNRASTSIVRDWGFIDSVFRFATDDYVRTVPLQPSEWEKESLNRVGRELSEKELLQIFGEESQRSLNPEWRRPVSREFWEGTR